MPRDEKTRGIWEVFRLKSKIFTFEQMYLLVTEQMYLLVTEIISKMNRRKSIY